MPLLAKEIDVFPADLLDCLQADESPPGTCWWALYTRSRREKQLMRQLAVLGIRFYSPLIERRYRSPNGRVRISYQPLFSNYVFLYGDSSERYTSLTTNCVSRCCEVNDGRQLIHDLRSIARLIQTGRPLTPETQLKAGDRVRVKSGSLAGFEGTVLRRDKETRLLVAVNFIKQGASVLLDDCQLEIL